VVINRISASCRQGGLALTLYRSGCLRSTKPVILILKAFRRHGARNQGLA